jgi:hypothetical protein
LNPAWAAAANRSMKGDSVNIMEILAASFGIEDCGGGYP